MITKHSFKKGDTLIEVALAVGIFSLVAVTVMSVMNGGSSNAQTALEATLAREEIDAQAEAIRFIHSAYVANQNITTDPDTDTASGYIGLWGDIVDRAINGSSISQDFYNYQPSTCSELYGNGANAISNNAFVIDTKALAAGSTENVVIGKGTNFTQASTYPRLVYKQDDTSSLLANNTEFYAAEGLYITAIKDPNTTIIDSSGIAGSGSSYYDFYIRSCWYGTGDKTPSTISTVIRLYNPEITSAT